MLKLEHIAKTFNPGTINEKHAIRDLSLELADGDFVTVIGGNGAGKSTLLNAVAGVWPVDAGSIFIGGEDVTGMPEYKRAQFIGLGLGLEKRMTAKVGLLSGGQRQALTLLMAALQTPKLLLLDEHTAALDPATAAKVLELSDKIIQEHHLTAMMITHNMTDAIRHGNRLIMMDRGRIVLDISGEEKKRLTKADLLARFAEKAGVQEETDEVLLS